MDKKDEENGVLHIYADGQYLGINRDGFYCEDQLYLENMLFDRYGNSISIEEAKNIYPHYTLMLAALNSEVRKIINYRLKTNAKPNRRIYISYRWESGTLKDWVRYLANYLRGRNYRVELDQDEDMTGFFTPALFMARMAQCDTVLMVLTQYFADAVREEVGRHRIGWVFDEQNLALKLQRQNLIRVVFVEYEKGYRVLQGALRPDYTINVQNVSDPWAEIGRLFQKA